MRTADVVVVRAGLAWESLTSYYERWHERVGGGCGFTRTGSAVVAGEEDAGTLRAPAAAQAGAGVDVAFTDGAGLAEFEPYAYLGDVHAASYQYRSAYADPSAATLGFLRGGGAGRGRLVGAAGRRRGR